jgi:hypothetical protein
VRIVAAVLRGAVTVISTMLVVLDGRPLPPRPDGTGAGREHRP